MAIEQTSQQGCPQDVKSQDRDETDMLHFFKISRPRRDWDVEPSRPIWDLRRSIFPDSQDRDETRHSTLRLRRDRDVLTETFQPAFYTTPLEITVPQFKNTNWWSLSLDNLFLAGHIHYFLPDISASLMHCMDVHKTLSYETRDPRPRRYIFKTETRPRRSRPRLHPCYFSYSSKSLVSFITQRDYSWGGVGTISGFEKE